MSNDRIRRAKDGGMSVFVGTVDGEGKPVCCRGIAVDSQDEFRTMTVYVPVDTSQETIANVATTRRIAIGVTQPIEHSALQFKGTTKSVRLARAEEAEFVRSRMSDFAEVLAVIGVPRHTTMRMTHWPAFAIEINVETIFDQTPGPNAGTVIR